MQQQSSRSLFLFFPLAFFFPWVIWGTTIAEQHGLINFHIPQSLSFWIGLTLATLSSAAITGGKSALRDLFRRMTIWKVNPIWFSSAFVLTSLICLVSLGINQMAGGVNSIGDLIKTAELPGALLFQIFFFLMTEELAWRGFALPRLLAKFSALNSSLLLGVLWGLWHLPLVFIRDSFQSKIPFLGFLVSTIAISIIFTWLYNKSNGSLLIAGIFHAATDVAIAYFGVMSSSSLLFWIFIVVQWIVVFIIILKEGAVNLSRKINHNQRSMIAP